MNSAAVDLFTRPSVEDWLAQRLEELGHPIGTDRTVVLKDRLRAVITTAGIGCVIAGRAPNGRPETIEESFARIFGKPLVPAAPRKLRSTQRKVQP